MKTTPRSQYWLDHINAQQSSGQTVKQYALTQGLNLQSFYTWRSTLKSKPGTSHNKTNALSISFVKAVNAERPLHPMSMKIRDAGYVLEFDEAPSPEWLHRFLQLRAQK